MVEMVDTRDIKDQRSDRNSGSEKLRIPGLVVEYAMGFHYHYFSGLFFLLGSFE